MIGLFVFSLSAAAVLLLVTWLAQAADDAGEPDLRVALAQAARSAAWARSGAGRASAVATHLARVTLPRLTHR